jgi:hypothetical protein
LVSQRARLAGYIETAAGLGDLNCVARLEQAVLANLTTVGKLLQQFVSIHETRSTNLLISPDYLQLRATLVDVLRAHPAAAIDVARALAELETDAAADITSRAAPPKQISAVAMIEGSDGTFYPPPPTIPSHKQ